jgi:hypothetical protein
MERSGNQHPEDVPRESVRPDPGAGGASSPDSKLVDRIIAYEQGELEEDDVVQLFQELIDNGHAWTLQGHYGRTAVALIEAGLCVPAK